MKFKIGDKVAMRPGYIDSLLNGDCVARLLRTGRLPIIEDILGPVSPWVTYVKLRIDDVIWLARATDLRLLTPIEELAAECCDAEA